MKYALITPARNEEKFIERTIESVIAQTLLPDRWIIVDDGSTDRTAKIVEGYLQRYPWIELVRQPKRTDRNFGAKAQAVNAGLDRVRLLQFEVIGNLDADVSFGPHYLEFLIQKFSDDPELGVAGTPFTEDGYDSFQDSFEGESFVTGACQLFRYRCFQEIGGYVPNRAGGVDWIAVMTARMKGWKARSFPEQRHHHHRSSGTAEKSVWCAFFARGEKDYYLGGSPLWQLCRVGYRLSKKPIFMGGMALLFGYCWAAMRRMERPITPELMRFHRREQMKKLKTILRTLLTLKKINNFSLGAREQETQ
jgi:glycosyltransferase involved in cell wall biosynthesis